MVHIATFVVSCILHREINCPCFFTHERFNFILLILYKFCIMPLLFQFIFQGIPELKNREKLSKNLKVYQNEKVGKSCQKILRKGEKMSEDFHQF